MSFSHYDWLKVNFETFLTNLNLENPNFHLGLISAHGDKCSCQRYEWEDIGIPFEHGVAIYLLTYIRPWSKEVRETEKGWINPIQWVKDNYKRFKYALPKPYRADDIIFCSCGARNKRGEWNSIVYCHKCGCML